MQLGLKRIKNNGEKRRQKFVRTNVHANALL